MKKVTDTTKTIGNEATLALAIGGPAFIEMQEARGQSELVKSAMLPVQMNGDRSKFEALGFVFSKAGNDPLFVEAKMPAGWSKQPTDHSMWSKIVDDKGRERARMFYKAAFYDRDAFMSLSSRYSIECDYTKDYKVTRAFVVDRATGEEIFSGPTRDAASAWLKENRPDCDDVVKSWEGA